MRISTDLPVQASKASVKTVVVPAAGMETRFLPATKTVPEELLPVVDTPGIELIAEKAAALGAKRLSVVVAPNKEKIMRHFGEFAELQELMVARGKDEQAASPAPSSRLAWSTVGAIPPGVATSISQPASVNIEYWVTNSSAQKPVGWGVPALSVQ